MHIIHKKLYACWCRFLCFTNSIWSIYFVIFMFKNKGKKKFKDKKITDTRRTLCSYSGFNGRFWKRDVQNRAPSAPRRGGGVWKYLTEFCKILRYLLGMSWDPLHIQSEKILSQKKTHVFCWSYRCAQKWHFHNTSDTVR